VGEWHGDFIAVLVSHVGLDADLEIIRGETSAEK
jgi:hypothetical protein